MAKKNKRSMRERAREKANSAANRGGSSLYNLPEGTEEFKPKAKQYELDFIPYEVTVDNHPQADKGDLWYQRTIWVHHNVGDMPRICPKTVGKACPVCEERKALMKEGNSDNDDLIDQLRPRERELYNVIDLNDEDKGIQLWNHSYFLFGEKLDEEIREGDEELADFAELEGGYTLGVRFKEKKMGKNPFYEATRIDFTERDDYEEDILDQTIDLDRILVIPTYEQLQKELHGVSGGDEKDEEDEEEEKPKKGRGKKKAEDKSDKDEKPAKKGGRKKKAKKEEPEEPEAPDMPESMDDLEELDTDALKAIAEHLELNTRGKADKLRERIAEELELAEPEAESEPEKPKKGRGKKKAEDKGEKPKKGKKAKSETEEKPKKGKKSESKKSKKDDEAECPAGGEFGADTDEYDECEECPLWADCREKKDEE